MNKEEVQDFKLKEIVGFEKILLRGSESDNFFLAKIYKWFMRKLYPWPKNLEDF